VGNEPATTQSAVEQGLRKGVRLTNDSGLPELRLGSRELF
jgi:hypothetical protein